MRSDIFDEANKNHKVRDLAGYDETSIQGY